MTAQEGIREGPDWASFKPPADWKQTGTEWHGQCPISGGGEPGGHRCWADPGKGSGTVGCHEHGDASGKLAGPEFATHAAAIGILPDIDLGGRGGDKPLDVWPWVTAAGRKRKQYRWKCCSRTGCEKCHGKGQYKRWSKARDSNTPRPADLLYIPLPLDGVPGPIYLCEGGSSADALARHGLAAVGFYNAAPTRESIERLPAGRQYIVWPDHDPAGYRQAIRFADAVLGIGRDVQAVDPLAVNPDAPPKWDPRDWTPPPSADPAAAILPAVVPLNSIRDRAPVAGAGGSVLTVDHPDTAAGVDEALQHCGFEHRKNTRADRCEVRSTDGGDWEPRSDEWCEQTRRTIRERCDTTNAHGESVAVVYTSPGFVSVLTAHAYDHGADPFLEWLEALPAWDGQPRPWLAECFPSLASNPLAEWASRAVTLAAVRLTFAPGDRVQESVVLVGAGGMAKSAAWAWLFPSNRREDWFTDSVNLAAPIKELIEAFGGRVLVEFGDMAGAHRADVGRLKSLLTTVSFGSTRLAYRRDPTPHPRRVVFAGTANPPDVLPADPSGALSRRFVLLPVGETEPSHVRHVTAYMDTHRAQVWAEALHRYRAGEPHHLPDDLKPLQASGNKPFEVADAAAVAMVREVLGDDPLPDTVRLLDVRDGIARRCETTGMRTAMVPDGRITGALKSLGYRPGTVGHKRQRMWVRSPAITTPYNVLLSSTSSTNRVNVEKVDPSTHHRQMVITGDRTVKTLTAPVEDFPNIGSDADPADAEMKPPRPMADRPKIPDSPPPAPAAPNHQPTPAELEAAAKNARVERLLDFVKTLSGAPDMNRAARDRTREMAGKARCRQCGGSPPLELTNPPQSRMLCGECAAFHRELSARLDKQSFEDLWADVQASTVQRLQDDPELRRLALEDPKLREYVH